MVLLSCWAWKRLPANGPSVKGAKLNIKNYLQRDFWEYVPSTVGLLIWMVWITKRFAPNVHNKWYNLTIIFKGFIAIWLYCWVENPSLSMFNFIKDYKSLIHLNIYNVLLRPSIEMGTFWSPAFGLHWWENAATIWQILGHAPTLIGATRLIISHYLTMVSSSMSSLLCDWTL